MEATMTDNKTLALSLATAGFKVIPCFGRSNRKAKAPLVPRGQYDATTDPEIIAKWFTGAADKLIGIPCKASGFFAVDADGPEGAETWDAWIKANGPVSGPCQKTMHGFHYLFKHPSFDFPGSVKKLGAGVDLRSNNYICTGGDDSGYEWIVPLTEPLPEAPAWLLAKIKAITPKLHLPELDTLAATAPEDPGAVVDFWLDRYTAQAFIGNRNEMAFKMGMQLHNSGVTMGAALYAGNTFIHAIPNAGGDSYFSLAEYEAAIKSAYKTIAREPATLPRQTSKASEPAAKVERVERPKTAAAPEVHIIPHIEVEPEFEADLERTGQTVADDTEGSGFKVLDMNYFMAERPEIQYIVEGIVAEGSVNLWYGVQGIGKTWSLYDAAVSAACGTDWLGLKVNQANALIVDEESGKRRLGDRIKMIARARGITHMPLKAISLEQINLLKRPADGDRLTIEIINQGARFVIIDALADIMLGGDENAVKDTQPVFAALRLIAELTGAAIIVIHHSNKLDGYRGSSAIAGAVDTMLHITGNTATGLISYKSEKMRDGSPTSFSAQADWTNGFSLTRTENTNQGHAFNKAERYVLRYLKDKMRATVNDIMDHADACAPGTARKAVYTLSDKNYIARQDIGLQGTEATYGLTDAGRAQSDQN
jgi:hypothetical protein